MQKKGKTKKSVTSLYLKTVRDIEMEKIEKDRGEPEGKKRIKLIRT